MRLATDFCPAQRGFTLIEMIVSIVIAGAVLAMVGLFGRQQIETYIDAGNRAGLADEADTALRRIARDLQSALPNSVRVSGNFLEFVPIRDAGRYRVEVDNAGAGDILDFSSAIDNSFDVLGPTVNITAGDQLVIFNLGQPGSDVYAGTSRRAANAGNNLGAVTFAPAGTQFPLASPRNRFHIVGTPVTYQCDPVTGTVRRFSGYGFFAVQPVAFGAGATSSILVSDVALCTFSFAPAVLQRNGLVVLHLALARNGESVDLLHQVDILNTP